MNASQCSPAKDHSVQAAASESVLRSADELVRELAEAFRQEVENVEKASEAFSKNQHAFSAARNLQEEQAAEKMEENESFALERTKHGRASDMMMALVMIHSFLGLIYTFQVI